MDTLVTALHVFVAFFLILVVLLQSGKGANMGAAFGGSSQTVFGSRGPASFLGKVTTAAAVIFMVTSLTLSVISSKSGADTVADDIAQDVPSQVAPVESIDPNALDPFAPSQGSGDNFDQSSQGTNTE